MLAENNDVVLSSLTAVVSLYLHCRVQRLKPKSLPQDLCLLQC